MTTLPISYIYLSQKITDCELPSTETLNTFSTIQQIENLKLCYDLSKDYFLKIKVDFMPHLEANKITELTIWLQLGHSARKSWVEDI
ncbi:36080_t:CDS:2, partial [Gigaspora margarita]